jgi:hypothetical protein
VAALLLFSLATPSAAQGKGKGPKPPPGTGVRQFGVWLDDAIVSPEGRGWATFGVGYTRAPFGHQWDLPSLDGGIGVSRHVQVGVTVPVSHVAYTGGPSSRSLGDAYLAVKVGLLDPAASGHSFGVAVAPLVEFLGSGSVQEGGARVFWALPFIVERRFQRFRAYGTLGYFSRGAVFLSGAVEVPINSKVTATATLSDSRSLENDPLSDAQQLARSRWDVSGGAVYFFSPKVTLSGSLGRTISRLDANASSLAVSAGVSVGFQHRIRGH